MRARSFIFCATWGRFSLILMPATAVAISLAPPPFLWLGLRSNVSIWLGPPAIHRRMQERLRFRRGAAASARRGNQPEAEAPRTPAADNFIQSRRESMGAFTGDLLELLTTESQRTQRRQRRRVRLCVFSL